MAQTDAAISGTVLIILALIGLVVIVQRKRRADRAWRDAFNAEVAEILAEGVPSSIDQAGEERLAAQLRGLLDDEPRFMTEMHRKRV